MLTSLAFLEQVERCKEYLRRLCQTPEQANLDTNTLMVTMFHLGTLFAQSVHYSPYFFENISIYLLPNKQLASSGNSGHL